MSEQEQHSIPPSRNTEEILENYNSDVKEMRAKAARDRITARQQAEQVKIEVRQYSERSRQYSKRAEQHKEAIENIPLEHRYNPDQAS